MTERLREAASGTASGVLPTLGTVNLTFDTPPTGTIWTGTIAVPSAEPFTKWTLTNNGAVIASWQGSTPAGPFQASDREALVLKGRNLTPLAVYSAYWVGSSSLDDGTTPYVSPVPIQPPGFVVPGIVFTASPSATSLYNSGSIFVGNLAQIIVEIDTPSGAAGEDYYVTLQWQDVINGTGFKEEFHLDPVNTDHFIDNFPVKGQFVQVVVQEIALGHNMSFSLTVTGETVINPSSAHMRGDQIFFLNTPTAIAAGATTTFNIGGASNHGVFGADYGSGEGTLVVVSSVKTWTARLQQFQRFATYVDVDGLDSHGTDLIGSKRIIVPRSTMALVINNNGAASGNFNFSIVGL